MKIWIRISFYFLFSFLFGGFMEYLHLIYWYDNFFGDVYAENFSPNHTIRAATMANTLEGLPGSSTYQGVVLVDGKGSSSGGRDIAQFMSQSVYGFFGTWTGFPGVKWISDHEVQISIFCKSNNNLGRSYINSTTGYEVKISYIVSRDCPLFKDFITYE